MIEIAQNKSGVTVVTSVHGLGLTGLERAYAEFGGQNPVPRNGTLMERWGKELAKEAAFVAWLAVQGLEIGRSRDGKWMRVVKTSVAEATPAGSIKCPKRRDYLGRIICYALPSHAYPFDSI
jgi:hypothetical protein